MSTLRSPIGLLCSFNCRHVSISVSSSIVPIPPGRAMNILAFTSQRMRKKERGGRERGRGGVRFFLMLLHSLFQRTSAFSRAYQARQFPPLLSCTLPFLRDRGGKTSFLLGIVAQCIVQWDFPPVTIMCVANLLDKLLLFPADL